MIISLKPWYTKLHIKFTNTTTSDEFYKFVYHTCLRNDYTGIVIDEPYEADTFVKETYLFKNIFYNIQITYLSEYEELNIPSKTDTYKVHYFCNEIFYDQLKSSIPCLGVYFNKYSDTHLTNVPVNLGETYKRFKQEYNDIEDYIKYNDNTLYLDNDGNVYYRIDFKTKVCNIFTDNIDVKLFQFVLKKGGENK